MQLDNPNDINPDQLNGNVTSQESIVLSPSSPLSDNFIQQVQRESSEDKAPAVWSMPNYPNDSLAPKSTITSSVDPLDNSPKVVGGEAIQITLPGTSLNDSPPAGLTGLNSADYTKKS